MFDLNMSTIRNATSFLFQLPVFPSNTTWVSLRPTFGSACGGAGARKRGTPRPNLGDAYNSFGDVFGTSKLTI